jgi:hypothetical protein
MADPDFDPAFAEHMKWLGLVAAIWAELEDQINEAIWELANVERWAGACITSQIFSPSARMRALTALLRVRKGQTEEIKKFTSLSASIIRLGHRRNEYVHDPWTIQEDTQEVKRIHVNTEGEFEVGFRPTPIDDLKRLYADISSAVVRFGEVRSEVFQTLPPWPRTQFEQSRGIRPHPLAQNISPKERTPPSSEA